MNSLKILALSNDEYVTSTVNFGLVAEEFQQRGYEFVLRNKQNGTEIPTDVDDFDGVVVSGGRLDVNDMVQADYIEKVSRLLRLFDIEERPVLGICLGGQILAHAHGGTVGRRHSANFGLDRVHPVADERADPILAAVDRPFPMYCLHRDEFSLPEGATLLMEGEIHRNALFRIGACSYGFQPHPELSEQMANDWFPSVSRQWFPDVSEQEQAAIAAEKLAAYKAAENEIKEFAGLLVAAWTAVVAEKKQRRSNQG